MVGTLQSLGATQILVLNMPDLGKPPLSLGMVIHMTSETSGMSGVCHGSIVRRYR